MKPLLWIVCVCALAACSGGPHGTASVDGSVQGSALAAKDAIFASFESGDTRQDAVLITDWSDACDKSQNNESVPNGTRLMLTLTEKNASGVPEPVSPGDFPISAPADATRLASAVFQKDDAACAPTLDEASSHAGDGVVTVTRSDADFVDGSFDLHFPGGAHLTGSFHAALCAEPTDLPNASCQKLRSGLSDALR